MANVFSPWGFRVVKRYDGASWNANLHSRLIASANSHTFNYGDPVIQLSTGYIDCVAKASEPTQGVFGIFVGCELQGTKGIGTPWQLSYSGTTTGQDTVAYVITDPWVVMQVWVGTCASSAAGGPAVLADIGKSIDYELGTGSATGISGAYVDYATISTSTATQPFIITGLVQNPPGVNGTDITTAGNIVEVVFNQSAFKVGVTPV